MSRLLTSVKSNKRHVQAFFICLMLSGIFIFLLSCSHDNEIEKPSPCTVDVKTVGAKGDGITMDTWAFQKAVDKVAACGGGTVYVPSGNYLIDADSSIKMKSNVTLNMMDTTAKLIAKKSLLDRYYLISIKDVSNVKIIGGKIIGDLMVHPDPDPPRKSEWGMGIGVSNSSNITISGTYITDCWGDGIIVAGSSYVTIKQVVSNRNRRQALSIISAHHITVDSCSFIYTGTYRGTKPMDGIDIEPDRGTAENITIQNCEMAFNKANGVEMNENSRSVIQNITVKNNYIHDNAYGGYIQNVSNVDFTYNRIVQNKYYPRIVAKGDTINCVLNPNTYQ